MLPPILGLHVIRVYVYLMCYRAMITIYYPDLRIISVFEKYLTSLCFMNHMCPSNLAGLYMWRDDVSSTIIKTQMCMCMSFDLSSS